MIDPNDLLDAWSIPEPRTLRPADAGANNRTYLVDTPGGAFVLRIYRNAVGLERLRYEHDLLLRLQPAGLSFATPRPLLTTSGNTFVATRKEGRDIVAACFPAIPGRRPRGGGGEVVACGVALGELADALARIGGDVSLSPPAGFGDLSRTHPLVPDPLVAVANLPLEPSRRARLVAVLEDLVEDVLGLLGRLPRHVIHADFYPSNVLLAGDRVSGVLDFEFAGPGPRAMDLAVGLWAFGVAAWGAGDRWSQVERFAVGYRRRVAPTEAEIAALPTLMRLREATSLVHWLGRCRQGLTTEADLARRADRVPWLDDELAAHGAELVQRMANVSSPLCHYSGTPYDGT